MSFSNDWLTANGDNKKRGLLATASADFHRGMPSNFADLSNISTGDSTSRST
ncbi:hypothetical protein OK016_12755 [Vibrio chagasii]|nr:hypothetical protein [Vibrio chagasii]